VQEWVIKKQGFWAGFEPWGIEGGAGVEKKKESNKRIRGKGCIDGKALSRKRDIQWKTGTKIKAMRQWATVEACGECCRQKYRGGGAIENGGKNEVEGGKKNFLGNLERDPPCFGGGDNC